MCFGVQRTTAAGYDKKTAQHAAALHALEQLQGEIQVKVKDVGFALTRS